MQGDPFRVASSSGSPGEERVESQQPIARWMMAGLVVGGAVLGGAAVELWRRDRLPAPTTAQTGAPPADLQRLNLLVPSQSHAMIDVGYHWTNLWFAAEQKNWRLAEFYFNEARSHMQWTILIRPIRKDDQNRDVDLQEAHGDGGAGPVRNDVDAERVLENIGGEATWSQRSATAREPSGL